MPPITTQQAPEYAALVRIKYPKGGSVTPPSFGPGLITLDADTSHADYDLARYLWNNTTAISRVMLSPTAVDAGGGSLPTGSGTIRKSFVASSEEILYDTFEVASASGVIATHVGRGIYDFTIDPSFRVNYPSGQAINATVTVRARKRQDSSQYLTWPTVTIATTGSGALADPAPIIIAQPQNRSFSEGVASTFNVNIASFFQVTATPATYSVLNGDGSALTDYTLNSITSGVASITKPSGLASGTKSIRFGVTDNNGASAFVSALYTNVANPLPQVLNSISSVSIDISQSGNFPIASATVFSDTEALTYSLVNSDDTAPPAGYSWDGTNLAYPVEGGAVARSFRLKATEQGALARSVTTAAFTFDRPATPVIIVTADPVEWPENATTAIDVNVRTILSTDAAEDVTIPAALSGKVSKSSLGSGVFRLTGTFADNEILSETATYSGTASGSPITANPTFRSIHNPPVIPSIAATAISDQPVIIDVVAQSDDANNLIVSDSVSANAGNAVLSADFKTITVTSPNLQDNIVTVAFSMTAPDGSQETAGTLTVDFSALEPPVANSSISTTSIDGTAFSSFSIASYFRAGSYPLDLASAQFSDSSGANLFGKTQTVTGAGSFTLDNSGNAGFTAVSGHVGTTNLYITINDVNGNAITSPNLWSHTQQAKAIDPPPPNPGDIFPNNSDGLPILQRGMEPSQHWTAGAIIWKNQVHTYRGESGGAGSNANWTTNLYTAKEKLERGEFVPATGHFTLAAGESTQFRTPRFIQLSAEGSHTNLYQGVWEWTCEIISDGGLSWNPGFGWALDPSPPAGFRRYTKTLDDSANGSEIFTVTGPGTIKLHYVGLVSEASDWETSPVRDSYLTDMAFDKVHRFMDATETNSSLSTRADEWIRDDDYLKFGGMFFAGTLTANHSNVRAGADVKMLASVCTSIGRALWLNAPGGFGGQVTEGDPLGWFGSRDSAGLMSYWPAIFAQAKIEYRTLAQRWIQSLINANYPDNFIFYVEYSNECWNSTFRINKYMRALQDYLIANGHAVGNVRGGGGAGYMLHLMAVEFAQVVSELKPNQQIRFVLGAQTATRPLEFSGGAIKGWDAYAADNPGFGLARDQMNFATTGYLSDGHKWSGAGTANAFGAQNETEWANAYASLWNGGAGVAALYAAIDAWYVDPSHTTAGVDSSVYGALADNIRHADYYISQGVGWIGQYEGSFHENLPNQEIIQTSGLMTAAQRRNVIRNWINSAGGYAAQKLFIQEMYARYPNAIISNYYKYHSTGHPGNPWYEKNFNNLGSTVANTASAAWEEFKTTLPASPPSGGLFHENFETNSTTTLLGNSGWSFDSGWNVTQDTGVNVLFNSTSARAASVSFRNPLQQNTSLAIRLKFNATANNATLFQLSDVGNGYSVLIKSTADGNLTVSSLNNPGSESTLCTTTGLNVTSSYVDLVFTYNIATSGGLVEVKDANTLTVYGTFSGNTNPTGSTAAHISEFVCLGGVLLDEIEDTTGASSAVSVTIGTGQATGAGLSFTVSPAGSTTAEYAALAAQMTSAPTAGRAVLYDNLFQALIAAGVLAKLDILYVLASHHTQAATLNWKSPTTLALSATGTPIFTADRGFAYDGSTNYHDTGYRWETAGLGASLNNYHLGVWSLSSGTTTDAIIGSKRSNGVTVECIIPRTASGDGFLGRANDQNHLITTPNLDATGHYILNRSGASARQAYKNSNALTNSDTQASTTGGDYPIIIGGTNYTTPVLVACDVAIVHAGQSLDSTEVAALYAALNTYMTAIGAA